MVRYRVDVQAGSIHSGEAAPVNMNLSSIVSILWRQRVVVIPATILAVVICVMAAVSSPPTYRASGSVVLLNPPVLPQTVMGGPAIPDAWQNPYTRIGDLAVIVDILVRVVGSEPVQADLVSQGFQGVPEVAANSNFYRGPIIDVAAEAPTAEAAMADVNILIDELNRQLAQLQQQQGTAENYYIKLDTVITPFRATTVFSGTARLLILAMAACTALVVLTGLLTDRVRSGRRASTRSRKRRAATGDGPDGESRVPSTETARAAVVASIPEVHGTSETPPRTPPAVAQSDRNGNRRPDHGAAARVRSEVVSRTG
jgi:hypothetical protein